MKKQQLSIVILLAMLLNSTHVTAQNVAVTDPGFVLLDVLLYRPAGLAATIAGSAIFLGMSPLTALASIPAPHDAFNKTFKILILGPAAYTFIRPLGERQLTGYAMQYPYTTSANHYQPLSRQPTISPYAAPKHQISEKPKRAIKLTD